jgi:hypothetical protein
VAHVVADYFTKTASIGFGSNVRQLLTGIGTGGPSTATQITRSVSSAATASASKASPEAAIGTTVTIPGAPATWGTVPSTNTSGINAWGTPVLSTDNDPITMTTATITITFTVANSGWTTVPTAAWTAILYGGNLNGGTVEELGRATSASITSGVVTLNITPTASDLVASPRLGLEIYVALGIGATLGTGIFSIATLGTSIKMTTGGQFTQQSPRTLVDQAYVTAFSEALVRSVTLSRAISDSIPGTADDLDRSQSVFRRSVEDVATTDGGVLVRRYVGARLVPESIPTSEVLVRNGRFARQMADSALVSGETLARRFVGVRTFADSAISSDVLVRRFVGVRLVLESALATEVLTTHGTYSRTLADSALTSETLARLTRVTRPLVDAAPVGSDSLVRVVVFNRFLVDSAPVTGDVLTKFFRGYRLLADSAPASESLVRVLTLVRQLTEDIGPTGGGTTIIVKKVFMPIFDD